MLLIALWCMQVGLPNLPAQEEETSWFLDGVRFSVALSLRIHQAPPRASTSRIRTPSGELHLLQSDRFDVWASSEPGAREFLHRLQEANDRIEELLGPTKSHLTLLELERPFARAEFQDANFVRREATIVGALPHQSLLATWVYEAVDESLARRKLKEDTHRMLLDLAQSNDVAEALHPLLTQMLNGILIHELGHMALIQQDSKAGAYGTNLPDWIEETVAVLCEPQWFKEQRGILLHDARPHFLSLHEFLESAHPDGHTKRHEDHEGEHHTEESWFECSFELVDRVKVEGNLIEAVTHSDHAGKPDQDEGLLYYTQCFAFGSFLMELGGAPLIREIVKAQDLFDALEQQGMPHSAEDIQYRWKEWLDERIGEDK